MPLPDAPLRALLLFGEPLPYTAVIRIDVALSGLLDSRLSRRDLLQAGVGTTLVSLVAACGNDGEPQSPDAGRAGESSAAATTPGDDPDEYATTATTGKLLTRRVEAAPDKPLALGLQSFGLAQDSDALLYVPANYSPQKAHSARGDAPRRGW